jgi:protein-S-isoprenylcysteine O-methyltransferase Ste14
VALLPALAFVLITDRWYIPFEEARMSAQFGAAYDDYRRRTRRWL